MLDVGLFEELLVNVLLEMPFIKQLTIKSHCMCPEAPYFIILLCLYNARQFYSSRGGALALNELTGLSAHVSS